MPLISTPAVEASEAIAADIVKTLVTRVNNALDQFNTALVWSLKRTWQPEGCTPAQVLSAMDTKGNALFEQSSAAVAYLWADSARRAEFIKACESEGLELTIVDGLPVFPARLDTTSHADGTVTITAE
jgi:hypothetical protein